MFLHLLLLLTLVPLFELWLLFKIKDAIDWGPTLALVIFTGVVGAALARREGMRTMLRINQSLAQGQMPATEMIEGLMISVAGVALITPGVLTDAIGLAVLIPPVRAWMRKRLGEYFKKRITLVHFSPQGPSPINDDVIDVEYRDVTDQPAQNHDRQQLP